MFNRTNTIARPSHDKKLLALLSGIIVISIAIIGLIIIAGVSYL